MASHNTGSVFPSYIDPRMYYQDVQLSQLNTKSAYEAALDSNQYTNASSILYDSDVDYYGSYLFNKSEDKLLSVQNYLLTVNKPDLMRYQAQEPQNVDDGMSWIS